MNRRRYGGTRIRLLLLVQLLSGAGLFMIVATSDMEGWQQVALGVLAVCFGLTSARLWWWSEHRDEAIEELREESG